VVCETDEFFHFRVGNDPEVYDFRPDLMDEARDWNFGRFRRALEQGLSPVIVDRGNSLSAETRRYAELAVDRGYRLELREPESEWWREIRVLLKYRSYTKPVLYAWAEQLAELSKPTHGVSLERILRQMATWKWDLSVEDILAFGSEGRRADMPEPASGQPGGEPLPDLSVALTPARKRKGREKPRPWLGDFLADPDGEAQSS
jgi:hypothetical protein